MEPNRIEWNRMKSNCKNQMQNLKMLKYICGIYMKQLSSDEQKRRSVTPISSGSSTMNFSVSLAKVSAINMQLLRNQSPLSKDKVKSPTPPMSLDSEFHMVCEESRNDTRTKQQEELETQLKGDDDGGGGDEGESELKTLDAIETLKYTNPLQNANVNSLNLEQEQQQHEQFQPLMLDDQKYPNIHLINYMTVEATLEESTETDNENAFEFDEFSDSDEPLGMSSSSRRVFPINVVPNVTPSTSATKLLKSNP